MKILIESLHGLGDTVCMLPMIENIRHFYPQAKITVLVKFEGSKEIVTAGNGKVDQIYILDYRQKKIKETIALFGKLRRERFDIGFACANSPVKKAHLFMRLIAPKHKVGIQFSEGKSFGDLMDQYHFVEANLIALQNASIALKTHTPKIVIADKISEKVNSWLPEKTKPRIGVCIGNADISYKNKFLRKDPIYTRGWGIHNTSTLCEKLLLLGYEVILLGGKQELDLLSQMPETVTRNAVSFVGRTTVMESAAITSLCDVVVGVDTGLQHISDAVGTKTVSIFGPTNPKTHGAHSENAAFVEYSTQCKYCYGTNRYVHCENRECLNRITVEMVTAKIQDILNI